nr:DUF6779 domain-containing protein [Corynebacterium lactis]
MTDFHNAGDDPKQSFDPAFSDAAAAPDPAFPDAGAEPSAEPDNPGTGDSAGEGFAEKTALILMVALLVLAVVASIVMLFASSTGWMKIAVLLALWSAVIGAVLVTRYRKTISAERQRLETIEELHRVELDRELATHREQELILEQNYLDSLEGNTDDSIAALRAEIFALREQLAQFMGDDFDDEQVALRAQAERLRELDAPQTSSPMKDPVANDRPEPRATAHRAEMTANGTVGAHTQHGAAGSPVEDAEDTNIQSEFKPSGQPVDVPEVTVPHSGDNPEKGKFSTDTFKAINWQETPAEDTRDVWTSTGFNGEWANSEAQDDWANSAAYSGWSSEEADNPTRQLQAIPDADVEPEEAPRHGRRRAEDHKNCLTVAELMAQMRKK